MNKLLHILLQFLINSLLKIEKKVSQATIEKQHDFFSLSPVSNATQAEQYIQTLDWALKNRKKEDIKNIALTGPYGSGKSSILKTYQQATTLNDLKFLSISLATFKEEKNNTDPNKENLLRLIELSILQQIFYFEKDRKIPDSRFKKIKSFGRWPLVFISLGLMLLAIAVVYLFFEKDTLSFFGILNQHKSPTNDSLFRTLRYTSVSIIAIGSFALILKSIRTIFTVSLKTLKIQSAEFELGESANKSILNNHIDEILYFFSVRPYNVVIIEDLDRFEQTEIFTKLREINLLLNKSKKIEQDIVFIYAVRDEMFQDKDRTKFFDFIIPVIPVINSSNSHDKLKEIISQKKFAVSQELVENISLFIDDMRLLYNITNEYYVYHKLLDPKLNQDKLLAMIVYKNIYPKDFVALAGNSGNLHNAIHSKTHYIQQRKTKIEEQIMALREQINVLDGVKLKNIRELRMLYLQALMIQVNNIDHFILGQRRASTSEMSNDDLFEALMADRVSCFRMFIQSGSWHNRAERQPPFTEIEKIVDPVFTYQQRESLIKDVSDKKEELLKKEIQQLEGVKLEAGTYRLQKLLSDGNLNIQDDDKAQSKLTNILLRNGYIGEDYLDYISIFYPESITREDHTFLLNLRSRVNLDFEFKLYKLDKLLQKLDSSDFDTDSIFNYHLLDFLLQAYPDDHKLDIFIRRLSNQSYLSVTFIDGFIKSGANVKQFIQMLCARWTNIWNFMVNDSQYPSDKKVEYYKYILLFAEPEDIYKISQTSSLKTDIENDSNFFRQNDDPNRTLQMLSLLNLKLKHLDFSGSETTIMESVCNGNHYAINKHNLEVIIKAKGNFDPSSFLSSNFSSILHSGYEKLSQYILDNLDEYIEEVYLKLEGNTNEEDASLLDLLNSESIRTDNKKKIIRHTQTKIEDIRSVIDTETKRTLIKESKVKPTWKNVIAYTEETDQQITADLIYFICKEDNLRLLTTNTLSDPTITPQEKNSNRSFYEQLIKQNAIDNASYEKLLISRPYHFSALNLEGLPKSKIELLIKHQALDLTQENLDSLTKVNETLKIKLLEVHHGEIVPKLSTITISIQDIAAILQSNFVSNDTKSGLINASHNKIFSDPILLSTVATLMSSHPSLAITHAMIMSTLLSSLDIDTRLKIFNMKFSLLSKEDISNFLASLPEPYIKINGKGTRPLLESSDLNKDLAANLLKSSYISSWNEESKGIRIATYY